jgi:hypothetical protein
MELIVLHILLSQLGPHNLNVPMVRYSLLIQKVVGFGEFVGFLQILQGQEIGQTIPLFQEIASDACSIKEGYGLYNKNPIDGPALVF